MKSLLGSFFAAREENSFLINFDLYIRRSKYLIDVVIVSSPVPLVSHNVSGYRQNVDKYFAHILTHRAWSNCQCSLRSQLKPPEPGLSKLHFYHHSGLLGFDQNLPSSSAHSILGLIPQPASSELSKLFPQTSTKGFSTTGTWSITTMTPLFWYQNLS